MMQLDEWTTPEVREQRMLEWARAYRRAVEKVEALGAPVVREEPKEQLHYTEDSDEAERRKPIFKPPLHKQRIEFAIRQIRTFVKEKGSFKKLVVIGCGDLIFERNCMDKFHLWGVDSVVSYDINRANLFRSQAYFNREIGTERHCKYDGVPCVMDVWKGRGDNENLTLRFQETVLNITAVLKVPMLLFASKFNIEHMAVKSAEELMRVMLDLIQPKLAVVSTPNYDYNKYIPDMKTQFRDPDHDYEFTKKEFEEWLQKVNRPQHYTYEIDFVGFLDRQSFDYYDDDDDDPYELPGKPINESIAEPARFSREDDIKDENDIGNHDVLVAGNDNGGATQIAIFKRLPTSEPLTVTDRSHHSFERAYSLVIPYGFQTVLRVHVQQAMIAYLKTDRLLSCATRELNYVYYLVPFKDVMEYASNEEYRFVMERYQDYSCSIIHRASHQFIHTTTEPMLPGSPHHQKGFRIPIQIPVKELLDYLEDFDW